MKHLGKRLIILRGSMPLAALVAIMLLISSLDVSVFNKMAEARYLPTRSDPSSETETLKGIIRDLLIEAATAGRPHAYYSRRFQQEPMGVDASQMTYLQRRAAEMSISSSNEDDSDAYLTGSFLRDANRNSQTQLLKQNNPKPDRR